MNGNWRYLVQLLLSTSLTICLLAVAGSAQESLPAWLTAEERTRIEKERGEKDRTEELLKVSTARLTIARTNLGTQEFELATSEIKNFGNLINYTVNFINAVPKKDKEKQKLYKILELNLRSNLNTLEMLRFELPEKYAGSAQEVFDQVQKVRQVALSAVFGKDFFPAASLEEQKIQENK
jgi:hypothetical protein